LNVQTPLKQKKAVTLTVIPLERRHSPAADSTDKTAEQLLTEQLTKRLASVRGYRIIPYATAMARMPEDRKAAGLTRGDMAKAMGVDMIVDGYVKKFSRVADEKGAIKTDLAWEVEFVDSSGAAQATGGAVLHAEGGHKLESVCEMSVVAVVEELKGRLRPSVKMETNVQ